MSVTTARARARSTSTTAFAVGGLALALVVVVLGNVGVQPGENGGTGPAIFTGVLCVLVTAALFGVVLPRLGRRHRANRVAVVLGALAVVSLVVFWSGLPPVLAGAAAAAGLSADTPSRSAQVLVALGALATALTVVVTVAGSHAF